MYISSLAARGATQGLFSGGVFFSQTPVVVMITHGNSIYIYIYIYIYICISPI